MSSILSIKDISINLKKILMRVDFNVPLDKEGKIADDSRIRASLPSINWVLEHGGALILMSHLGRPKGKDKNLSLKPCAERLSQLLGREVRLVDLDGVEVKPGEVVLLENLRFNPAEEKPEKDPAFAKKLAELGDIYVNDAFSSSHRAHSSITEVPKYFQKSVAAGFLLEKEIRFLGEVLKNPARPFVAIVGGAKISTKIGILAALLKKADKILIGGAMAFTFLKSRGVKVGDSFVEDIEEVPKGDFILPIDFVCEKEGKIKTFSVQEGIKDGWRGMDIGPKSIELFKNEINSSLTLLWNGPLGVFEDPRFAKGTEEIAKAAIQLKAVTIAGGGDTSFALEKLGLQNKFTHLSTGGGASLEFIEYGTLPGIDAIKIKT